MGLRCLLGHDFGPSGVVREHEEDGSEMVVTEREIRRCRRCGEEQVLSESTEVRAIRTEADVGRESNRRDADAVAPASSTQGAVDPEGDAAPEATALSGVGETVSGGTATDVTFDDAGPSVASDDGDEADSNTSLIDRAEQGFDDPPDPTEEDAVILDDDETVERGHGEWPDSDVADRSDVADTPDRPGDVDDQPGADAATGEAADVSTDDTPDVEDATVGGAVDSEDESDDAPDERSVAETAASEDAELLDAGSDAANGRGASVSHSNGRADTRTDSVGWPVPDGDDEGFGAVRATPGGPEMSYGNSIAPHSTNGENHDDGYETSYLDNTVEERDGDGTIVSARSDEVVGRGAGVETEYYCPNCGHARPLDSSLRSGDICPECQQGYIAEREC
jgi:hypothetical protein